MNHLSRNEHTLERETHSELQTVSPAQADPPGLPWAAAGQSAAAQALRARVGSALSRDSALLLTGERGTGKAFIARYALGRAGGAIVQFDAESSGTSSWLEDVRDALVATRAVLITHLDRLDPRRATALAELLAPTGSRVMATAMDGAAVQPEILRYFRERIRVPSLRERIEDIPVIAALIIGESSPDRQKRLGPDARRLLWQYSWPGNLSELECVLLRASRRTPARVIDACYIDLPRHGSERTSRPSPLERAERAVLVDALSRCGGNKLAAADLLGIARSTLYRKLRAFGVDQPQDQAVVREYA